MEQLSNNCVIASHTAVVEEDKALLDNMLNSVGVGMELQEHYMDIITGLTAWWAEAPSFIDMKLL